MDEWVEIQLKKYAPLYKSAISNFEKNAYKRLAALRKAIDHNNKSFNSGISQRALAYIADILPQNYNKIERGRINGGNNVTLEQAIKMSIIFGCTIDYIATGKTTQTTSDGNDKAIESLQIQLETERKLSKLLAEENDRFKKLLERKK